MEFELLMLYSLVNIFQGEKQQKRKDYKNESEVKKMTMNEVKAKMLDKIDELLKNADAEDVKILSEAYANMNRDIIFEKMAEQNHQMLSGFGGCIAPETKGEEQK